MRAITVDMIKITFLQRLQTFCDVFMLSTFLIMFERFFYIYMASGNAAVHITEAVTTHQSRPVLTSYLWPIMPMESVARSRVQPRPWHRTPAFRAASDDGRDTRADSRPSRRPVMSGRQSFVYDVIPETTDHVVASTAACCLRVKANYRHFEQSMWTSSDADTNGSFESHQNQF